MSKRDIPEINAGSMADIAFLLLIFFLVTTTMDVDAGINRNLPQKQDASVTPPVVKARNVFEVKANKYDQLLVEYDLVEINELSDRVIEFYKNPDDSEDLPVMIDITKVGVTRDIQRVKGYIAQAANDDIKERYEDSLKIYTSKFNAVNWFGEYRELPKNAMISLKSDNATSYQMYINVQNEIQYAINEMRNELTQKAWNINFEDLKDSNPEDQPKIEAVRRVIPMRVAEAPPKSN